MHVAVLMGGVSREHPVSLKSGSNIAKALVERGGHQVCPVLIHRSGRWSVGPFALEPAQVDEFLAGDPPALFPEEAMGQLRALEIEVVFPALHGPGGEDGLVQGLLASMGFPFVGSDIMGAALSSDKLISKALYIQAGLPVAPSVTITTMDEAEQGLKWGLPVVLKAPSQGSSFGLTIPQTEEEYHSALEELLLVEGRIMVERFVTGRELTCGVLELPGAELKALPPTEIIPKVSGYFDFAAKYEVGGSDEITPARIPPALTERVQRLALEAHRALRMGGLSRTDFILSGENELVLLETNALPGFTETSLFPQAAQEAGLSFVELVEHLLKGAQDFTT